MSRKPGFDVPWGIGFLVLCAVVLWLLQLYGIETGSPGPGWGLSQSRNRLPDSETVHGGMIADIAMMVEIGLFCAARYKCNAEKVTGLVPGRFLEYLLPAALCGVLLTAMRRRDLLCHSLLETAMGSAPFSREATAAHLFAWCLHKLPLITPDLRGVPLPRPSSTPGCGGTCACAPSVLLSSALFALAHGWTDTTFLHLSRRSGLCDSPMRRPGLLRSPSLFTDLKLSNPLKLPPSILLTEFGHLLPRMSRPRYSLKATATVSCIYAAGMLLCIGYLYLVPSIFDYWGPASEAYQDGDYEAAAEYFEKIVELRPRDSDSHYLPRLFPGGPRRL